MRTTWRAIVTVLEDAVAPGLPGPFRSLINVRYGLDTEVQRYVTGRKLGHVDMIAPVIGATLPILCILVSMSLVPGELRVGTTVGGFG